LFDARPEWDLLKTALNSDLQPRDSRAAAGAFVRVHLGGNDGYRYGEVVQFAKGMDLFSRKVAVGKTCSSTSPRLRRLNLAALNEGQIVEYQEVANKGKTSAENLKVK
jgi:cold shock protein